MHAFLAMLPTQQFVLVFYQLPNKFGYFDVDFEQLKQVQGF